MVVFRKGLVVGAAALASILSGCVQEPPSVVARNIPIGQDSSDANRPDIAVAPGMPHNLYRICGITQ